METVQLVVIMPGLHQPDPHSCRTYFDSVMKYWCKEPALSPQSMMELAVVFLYWRVGHLKSSVSKTGKDIRNSWTVVGAPNYEAAMTLFEEIRSPPFSGCACTLEWKAAPWGYFWATPSFLRQLIFRREGNDLCTVGGQGDAVRKHHLEEGDQKLETEPAATSHIGLLSSFSVYFPGMPPGWGVCCQQCSAAGHAVHSALSLPLLGDIAHFLSYGPPCLLHQPQAATLTMFP